MATKKKPVEQPVAKPRGRKKAPIPITSHKPRAVQDQKDPTLTDMKAFYDSVNWAEWWEEFYLKLGPSGLPEYRSTWTFCSRKAKNDVQRKFLLWLTGEKGTDQYNAQYAKVVPDGPQDWPARRKSGGWFNDSSLKAITRGIRTRMFALDALREAGNGLTLNSFVRMESLAQKIDEAFNGQPFIETLTFAENVARANVYLSLQEKVLHMIGEAQELYANSHGINLRDAGGFQQLVAGAVLSAQIQQGTQEGGAGLTPEKKRAMGLMERLITMSLDKSEKYGLPLPENVKEIVVEASK